MNNFKDQVNYWAHMLDESFSKELIFEDKEGKNINKAEKWIKQNHPEVIGKHLEDGTTITPRILTQEIRNTIPNVRMADCKFLVGATRLYFDGQSNPDEMQSQMNKLNKMLKIICTAHADEYDNDFNGLSFEELDKKFSGAVKKELDLDRDQIGKLQLIKNNEYDIVPIDSFDEASKYAKYTSWCVTHYDDMYSNYTKGGLGRFYFCLQKGFENVPEVKGEGCPMDAYGKSMIAISVNDDGSLNTCTCRWNHDNSGDDNMMDTKEISEFFGIDFYKTFKPYDVNQLWERLLKNQIPLKDLKKKEKTFCETFKCIATYKNDSEEYPDSDDTFEFKKLIDGKIITLPFIDATTTLIDNEFVTLKDEQFVKITPKTISNMSGIAKGEFIIPDGIKTIGDLAFNGCKDMTNVIIPNSVTKIGEGAFENCHNLTSVTIPDSVMSIGEAVFEGCSGLKSMIIPDSVKSIEEHAFSGCSELTSVTIGNSVTSIGVCAFRQCSSLTSIIIPDNVINVERQAFEKCDNLINVKIGKGVSSIGENVFYNCQKLQSLQIATSNPFYKFVSGLLLTKNGKTLISCIKNDNVIIPDTVENIGNSAFFGSKITNITIPDNVKSIGSSAFYYSNLKSVIIPDSVKSIGEHAFFINYSDVLKTVYVKGSIDKVKSLYKWSEKTEFKQVDSLNEMKCDSMIYYWAHMLDKAFPIGDQLPTRSLIASK